jgi:uncharacterized membrane protein YhaH (DUF805 family)
MDKLTDNRFLFSFEGRINRAKYWYAVFASSVACLVFLAILALVIGGIFGAGLKSVQVHFTDLFGNPPSLPFRASFNEPGPAPVATLLFYAAGTPIFIVSIWFLAATTIKRLHDRDKSVWWIVPFFITPNLLNKLWDWLDDPNAALLVSAIGFGLSLWAFIEMLCLKGTRGPNRFGPDPLAPVDTATHSGSRWDQNSALEFVAHSAGPSPESHVKRGHD